MVSWALIATGIRYITILGLRDLVIPSEVLHIDQLKHEHGRTESSAVCAQMR